MGATMTARRGRGRRAKASVVALTERDYALLFMLAEHRYVSTAQVARELFPSIDRCRRRVRQLFDAGYVAITLVGSTVPNLVSLTTAGVRVLEAVDPAYAATIRLPGTIRSAGVAHHLACVDARLYVTALAVARGEILARWSNNGGEIGRELGLGHWRLEPDGLAEVELAGGGAVVIACEADCGTETTRVLEAKLDRYRSALAAGVLLDELWFVVAAGAGRLGTIADLVHARGLDPWTRVLPIGHVTTRPVRPVAAGAAQEGHQRPNSVVEHREEPARIQRVAGERVPGDRRVVRGG